MTSLNLWYLFFRPSLAGYNLTSAQPIASLFLDKLDQVKGILIDAFGKALSNYQSDLSNALNQKTKNADNKEYG